MKKEMGEGGGGRGGAEGTGGGGWWSCSNGRPAVGGVWQPRAISVVPLSHRLTCFYVLLIRP